MAVNVIGLIIIGIGSISIIVYAFKNIKAINNRQIPKKELRKMNKKQRAKKKYG